MQVEVLVAFAPVFVAGLEFVLRQPGCEVGRCFAVEVQVRLGFFGQVRLDFFGQVRLDFFGCHAHLQFVWARFAFVAVEVVV